MSQQKHHSNKRYNPQTSDRIPRNVTRRIIITSQTAYHLQEIALQEGVTEGMVVDKLMRTYLASRRLDYYNKH